MPVKHMSINEFVRLGALQEANRQFFHPLGLALEVTASRCRACDGSGFMEAGPAGATYSAPCTYCDDDGLTRRISGVWDFRDDPEGIYFQLDETREDALRKERAITDLRAKHWRARCELFGSGELADGALPPDPPDVQPIDWER